VTSTWSSGQRLPDAARLNACSFNGAWTVDVTLSIGRDLPRFTAIEGMSR
jgi:hypothetical protein